jgi:tRNA (guanine37-N1)-methyltransferase
VIYLSPQGKPLKAKRCHELAELPHLVLLCGHYEGIDQRVLDSYVDEEISIGDFVLTNGCLAATVLVDAVGRLVPGVVGDENSLHHESFEQGLLDWPHYTRPEEWRGENVPEVLLSGHHEKIASWRNQKALEKTRLVRPDLAEEKLQEKIR